jgi:hypothetical protein
MGASPERRVDHKSGAADLREDLWHLTSHTTFLSLVYHRSIGQNVYNNKLLQKRNKQVDDADAPEQMSPVWA